MIRLAPMLIICLANVVGTYAQEGMGYYFPNVSFDPSVPTPKGLFGFEIGEWHLSHDKLVQYLQAVESVSPRIKIKRIGYTHEMRPLELVFISSVENIKKLEELRLAHLDQIYNKEDNHAPVVTWLAYSVHGNEPSGSNASALMAYYLAASTSDEVTNLLKNSIIIIDPCQNPDGMQRFANWVNSNKSKNVIGSKYSREANEPWPKGRTNHYWFDLNRDWLMATQPESRARLKEFYQWRPALFTDHHEMGEERTLFFQPGVPQRINPMIGAENRSITLEIAQYHIDFLDKEGVLYFTEEDYDDFYFGKGSTFPDINGSVGILFEQGSSRGHLKETEYGQRSFSESIKNQILVSLSTLNAVNDNKEKLIVYQQKFFSKYKKTGTDGHGFLVGAGDDHDKAGHLKDILDIHNISYQYLKGDIGQLDPQFYMGTSFYIPLAQTNYELIEALFLKPTDYQDSIFYDISAWSLDLVYDLDFARVSRTDYNSIKDVLTDSLPRSSYGFDVSNIGYFIDWENSASITMLYQLLGQGIRAKCASKQVQVEDKLYSYGGLFVPNKKQKYAEGKLHHILQKLSVEYNVQVIPIKSGRTKIGPDFGSDEFIAIRKPEVLMLVGDGISYTEAGALWHEFDQRYNIQLTLVEKGMFQSVDLGAFNVLILPSGNYKELSSVMVDKLKFWVSNGGVVISESMATSWLKSVGLTDVEIFQPSVSSYDVPSYDKLRESKSSQRINGAIFKTALDLSHPLCYGLGDTKLPVFRNNVMCFRYVDVLRNPVRYDEKPLLVGYVSEKNLNQLNNSAYVHVCEMGKGKVISFVNSTVFRGFCLGTGRLLMNAVFFGNQINTN